MSAILTGLLTQPGLIKASAVSLLAMLLMAGTSGAQAEPANTQHRHPAPGTSIVRFAELEDGLYKGSKPKNDEDYRFLQSKHIKYIVDIKFFPVLYRREKSKAQKYGMVVIPATLNASPVAPSEKHVNRILCLLHNKRLRPMYFHCDVGRDRTSLIATLYEVYFRNLPPEQAWKEMKHFGFKDDWTLRGLRKYLQTHSKPRFTPDNECSTVSVANSH